MPHLRAVKNQWKHIRVGLHEESGGRFTFAVSVKPAGAQWHQRHLVLRRAFRMSDPPATLPEVYTLLVGLMADLAGPEHSE